MNIQTEERTENSPHPSPNTHTDMADAAEDPEGPQPTGRGEESGRNEQQLLRGDPRRITDAIEQLAKLSEPGPGVTRLAYSSLEREAHALFAEWLRAAGCTITTDAAGNTIGTRPGLHGDVPAIGTGSHLDSVYNGGRFDGIAGVIAAAEIARQFAERDVHTRHPVKFVAFAGEEGARFGQACLGSKLAAELASEDELHARRDSDGITVAEAMRAVGLDPHRAVNEPWNPANWGAFLELHIEQGSVLDTSGVNLGIVDLISGSTRVELTFHGLASHTGGTPMRGRSDALAAASESVLIAEELALDPRHRGTRATIGRFAVEPSSITTIPGRVECSLDVRDIDADRQRETTAEIVRRVQAACDRRGVTVDVRFLGDTSPVVLPMWVRQAVTDAAARLDMPYRVLTSGASHDSQLINRVTPTGLLFVPSKEGLSHVPQEWTSATDLAAGVEVLGASLMALDRQLAKITDAAASTGEPGA